MFSSELAPLRGQPRATVFTAGTANRLFSYLKLELYVTGLPVKKATTLANAIQLLATSSICRGATPGTVSIWNQPEALICEVTDDAMVTDVMLGRRATLDEEGAGFRHAHDLGDLVQIRSSSTGTKVRIHTWK